MLAGRGGGRGAERLQLDDPGPLECDAQGLASRYDALGDVALQRGAIFPDVDGDEAGTLATVSMREGALRRGVQGDVGAELIVEL